MHDHFGVAVGLEDRATVLQLAPPFPCVRQVAIVAERDLALVAIDHDGLRIKQGLVTGSGIASVADRGGAGQLCQDARLENFFDLAHGLVHVEFVAVAGDYAGRLLAAMLQRVKTKIGDVRRFGMPENAEPHHIHRENDRPRMRVLVS